MVEINLIKLDQRAKLPQKNFDDAKLGDACYDVFAIEDVLIPPKGSLIIPTGLQLANITPGYWIRWESRSGNGFKKDLLVFPGVVDNPYRGNIGLKIFNFSDEPQTILAGNGLAQLVVFEMVESQMSWAEEVTESARGANGFGHSDKK